MTWLRQLAGDGATDTDLVEVAAMFLEAGGSVSPANFLILSDPERGALVAAGRKLRAQLAAATGAASISAEAAATALAPHDGGKALEAVREAEGAGARRSALEAAVNSACDALETRNRVVRGWPK